MEVSSSTTDEMSHRTDEYLNICFEQAAKSPLDYRHGYVIAHGGKATAKDFNDYLPS